MHEDIFGVKPRRRRSVRMLEFFKSIDPFASFRSATNLAFKIRLCAQWYWHSRIIQRYPIHPKCKYRSQIHRSAQEVQFRVDSSIKIGLIPRRCVEQNKAYYRSRSLGSNIRAHRFKNSLTSFVRNNGNINKIGFTTTNVLRWIIARLKPYRRTGHYHLFQKHHACNGHC